MTDDIELDGSTVTVGETHIVLKDEDGAPLALDHCSEEDGYAAYILPSGDRLSLHFMEGSA